MKHLIFLLANCKALLVAFVVLQLLNDLILFVLSTHILVLDHYPVEFALVNEAVVLAVSDLTLGTCFQLLPGLLFNHGSVGVHVLALQTYFLELLSESSIFSCLVLLFLVYFFISLYESLVSNGFLLGFQLLLLFFFLLAARIVFSLALEASFLDFRSCFEEI